VAANAAEGDGPGRADSGALAAEWFAAYNGFLKRTAEQSSGTLDLYQAITERVVRGEMAPTAMQEMLGGFVRSRGNTYSEELAQLNMRFMSEAVRIGTAFASDLTRAVLPHLAPPPPPPPYDASDPAGWFQQVGAYAEQLGASMAAAYRALAERAAADEGAPTRIQEQAAAYLERRLPEYIAELGRLYFDLLGGLTDLRARSEQEFLHGVLATANGAEDEFALTLTAPLGQAATASLSISNTRDVIARIRCDVREVRRADGVGPAFAPVATVAPDGLELEPGAEGSLELTVVLEDDHYAADALYVGTLHITGHGEPRLEVPLRITATP